MTQKRINIGTSPNKGDGDPLRTAFGKINDNFDELYATDTNTKYHLGDDIQFVDIDPDSGTIVIQSGFDTGMPVYIKGANCSDEGVGGNVVIEAGGPVLPNDGTTGNIELAAQQTTIESNNNMWTFRDDGVLELPEGGDIVDSNGDTVLGTGSWTFDTVTATTDGNIIVKAGGGEAAWASLLSNNGANSFWVDNVGAHVTSNFVEGEVTENYWTFGTDGGLTFPDSTVQSTAWTGITGFGEGFSLTAADKIVTNKLYSTNLTQPTQHYRLELDTNGVVVLPDQSIINGSYMRAIHGSYAGLAAGPDLEHNEDSWMWVDSSGAWIATDYSDNEYTWHFNNDGGLTFPNGALKIAGNTISNYVADDDLGSGSQLEVSQSKTVITNGVTNSLGGGPSLTSQSLFEVSTNGILSSFQVINTLGEGESTLTGEYLTELDNNSFKIGQRITNDLGDGSEPLVAFNGWTFGTVDQQQVLTLPGTGTIANTSSAGAPTGTIYTFNTNYNGDTPILTDATSIDLASGGNADNIQANWIIKFANGTTRTVTSRTFASMPDRQQVFWASAFTSAVPLDIWPLTVQSADYVAGDVTSLELSPDGTTTWTFGDDGSLTLPGDETITDTKVTNWDTAYEWGDHSIAGYVTGTPWTEAGYVTGTPWTEAGYVTGTPWTEAGYVTGTPWTEAGYLTAEADTLDSVTTRGNTTTNDITVGDLTVSGEIKTAAGTGDVVIEANNGVARTWTFGGDGALTFPDTTVQTTAYKRTTGSWTVAEGSDTYSFTVPTNGTYTMWVKGSIDNGIIVWNATASVSNTNVPVIGQQFAWNYTGGGTPIEFTAIPTQFIGTANNIVSSNPSVGTTSNKFDFVIDNTSGSAQTVYWGYVAQ